MDALLKRREELIKAKQEIERKLKLAGKIKCKDENIKTLTTINEEIDEESRNGLELLVFDMKWDNDIGRLAVLTTDYLHLKSLISSDTSYLMLPERADKDTELILENSRIGLCYKHGSFLFYNKEWHKIADYYKLIGLNRNLNLVLFNCIEKKIKLVTWPDGELLHEIDDIEKIFKTTEMIKEGIRIHGDNENSKDDILALKADGSLTYW